MTQILQAGYRISQAFWNSRSVVTEMSSRECPSNWSMIASGTPAAASLVAKE